MKIVATGTTGTIGKFLNQEVKPLKLDLGNSNEFKKNRIFNRDETVLHLAGIVGERKIIRNVKHAHKVNVEGTLTLARCFLNQSEGKFIFTSTAHVYKSSLGKLDESCPTESLSNYSRQKLEAENELRSLFKLEPRRLLILRVFSILDWNLDSDSLSGAISRLQKSGYTNTLINGDDIRDFLTPKTVANVLCRLPLVSTEYQTINLCSGIGTTVRDAAFRLLDLRNIPRQNYTIESGNSNIPIIAGNSRKITEMLGVKLKWTPK
jgi:nucleoside-diphosphate-sugar epimerase